MQPVATLSAGVSPCFRRCQIRVVPSRMGNLITFNVFIPNQNPVTGKAHPRTKFDRWQRAALDIATRAGVEQELLLHPREEQALDAARREIGALLSVAQAAERIGISKAAVYKAISKGALETVQIGAMTLVVLASAKAYRKARARHAA